MKDDREASTTRRTGRRRNLHYDVITTDDQLLQMHRCTTFKIIWKHETHPIFHALHARPVPRRGILAAQGRPIRVWSITVGAAAWSKDGGPLVVPARAYPTILGLTETHLAESISIKSWVRHIQY